MTREQTQLDKFKDAAREHGCDEDEARWEARLRTVVIRNPAADILTPESGPPTNH